MKKLLLIMGLCLFPAGAYAQTVYYGYDAAGNRTRRSLTPQRIAAPGSDSLPVTDPLTAYKVTIYPNPVQVEIYIDVQHLPQDSVSAWQVYNLAGTVVAGGRLTAALQATDFSAYPTGIYIVQVMIGKDKRAWKIVKE